MNKQQFYTFGGALLASTALSGAANAITIGKYDGQLNFSTSAFSIANTLFSTTASTANGITITPTTTRIGARFSNIYSSASVTGIAFSIEFTPSGGEFTSGTATLGNVNMLLQGTTGTTFYSTVGASTMCTGAIGFGTSFVINGCTAAAGNAEGASGTAAAGGSLNVVGLLFSGVTFTNASGLASAGSSVSLTGRVYNTATSGNFEAAATGAVITSAAPVSVTVTAGSNVTASATTTPTAFTSLSTTNGSNGSGTMDLATIVITGTGALIADLATVASPREAISTVNVTVQSAVLSSGALSRVSFVRPVSAATTVTTIAVFSGGAVTFTIQDADLGGTSGNTFTVRAVFNGTTAIPTTAAGTVNVVPGVDTAGGSALASATGATAAINQGGFRAEINTFNSSTNGPYSSYLRIHNNGGVAGTVTITIRNDSHDSGATLGSAFTTAAIQPYSTMQLSAAEMEVSTTSTKLPSGGANVPAASRVGSYTLSVTGPIVGYVQHILFDGQSVADLSSFRNGGSTSNAP